MWQLQRLGWKLDLIAKVEARTTAPPAPLPPSEAWPQVNADEDAYRHVEVQGTFLRGCEMLVTALTELGGGYWVMTPLEFGSGVVLVNRGFVPSELASSSEAFAPPAGTVTVAGLLRMSEPGGTWLRRNDPAAGRWFSRDVSAIAGRCGLSGVAPFFIDEDGHSAGSGRYPVGGLTVVRFDNNHLLYAIIWFGLAALSAAGFILMLRLARRTGR